MNIILFFAFPVWFPRNSLFDRGASVAAYCPLTLEGLWAEGPQAPGGALIASWKLLHICLDTGLLCNMFLAEGAIALTVTLHNLIALIWA